ncbi:MAG: ABC transporter ATP-binding protein [Clostridia bacterium]|nr:ABC transporter ATP-binding protein [Clostridia bacterium]MBR4457735.1 ABC transporter ATP-binding protein [Clostridia bacterium]
MLESREVTMRFGSTVALDHVTLRLEPGHIYALLGPNGSGKTTWMKLATGLLHPTEGQMLWKGETVGMHSREDVAYMSTEPFFYPWMTAKSVGKYYEDFFADFDPARYEDLLRRMDLAPGLKVKNLSSGMMAKMKVAVTLARRAKVYLLDEPFNGIDLLARDQIARTIVEAADSDTVLAMSSHLVEEMEAIADWAVFIKQGRLVESCDLETMRQRTGLSMADRYRQVYADLGAGDKEVL